MSKLTLPHLRRIALMALVLLPVLIMSVFPQGTMAARGEQGMEVVLCTGNGPLTVIVDENGAPIEEPQAEVDCGWWLLGQSLCDIAAQSGLQTVSFGCQTLATLDGAFAAPSQATTHHPARGPPQV